MKKVWNLPELESLEIKQTAGHGVVPGTEHGKGHGHGHGHGYDHGPGMGPGNGNGYGHNGGNPNKPNFGFDDGLSE